LQLPDKDAPVIEAMKSLSAQCLRYGYRRIDATTLKPVVARAKGSLRDVTNDVVQEGMANGGTI